MIDNIFLDNALVYLKEIESWSNARDANPKFTNNQNDYLFRAYVKMEKDGFVYSKEGSVRTFYISIDGIIALENSKNSPYKMLQNTKRKQEIWNVVKIIAVAVNSIIVLLFTALTFFKN